MNGPAPAGPAMDAPAPAVPTMNVPTSAVPTDATADRDATAERLEHLAALGEIGASVIHEARNMLTGTLGFAQLSVQRCDDPEVQRMLQLLHSETVRCVGLLGDFLKYARQPEETPQPVAFGPLLSRTAELVQHRFANLPCALHVEVEPELPLVLSQPGKLQQVLVNLLLNAAHASGAGGRVRAGAMAVPRAEVPGIEIAITDTGGGVPEALRERIFEPFFSTRPAGEGTGLGLPFSRRVVQAHGGSLTVHDGETGGAEFRVWLPCAGPADHGEEA